MHLICHYFLRYAILDYLNIYLVLSTEILCNLHVFMLQIKHRNNFELFSLGALNMLVLVRQGTVLILIYRLQHGIWNSLCFLCVCSA